MAPPYPQILVICAYSLTRRWWLLVANNRRSELVAAGKWSLCVMACRIGWNVLSLAGPGGAGHQWCGAGWCGPLAEVSGWCGVRLL